MRIYYFTELFFSEYHGRYFSFEIQNVRAEQRERRQKLRESAVRRLEKKLLENGYESLEKFSADRCHADKWLGEEGVAELEQMRLEKEKEKKEQPVQLSLFDMEAL